MNIEDFVPWFMSTLFVGIVGFVGYGIYSEIHAEKFYLRKDSWTCTSHHMETTLLYQQIGNVTTVMPVNTAICDDWRRK